MDGYWGLFSCFGRGGPSRLDVVVVIDQMRGSNRGDHHLIAVEIDRRSVLGERRRRRRRVGLEVCM